MPNAIMEAFITHLLRNNDPLSDTTNQEVKELLKTPLGELDEIDEQISNLQAQVKSLEERRNEIQKCVYNYHLLLSPIPDFLTMPSTRYSIIVYPPIAIPLYPRQKLLCFLLIYAADGEL
ncbi:hypothetical protein CPB84DRAFT_709283 [Gymnopilus junonius]|uniref:Uncharacterized protein n=1 Tax=Gymnopilus junonius TaxID=109634 RepID=A0A9P5NU54_GYMJU|nr:hypothetical protein CPB84DRAFT_709283 [Gymnopilus junonius]